MKELRNKNAFVTGAASGIGLGICRALAREGVNVALADIEQEPLDKAVAEIAALGVRSFGMPLDVSDEAAVDRAAEKVATGFDGLHLLVNNAGVTFAGSPLLGVPQRQFDWIFGVNVFGALNCLRAFVPLIRKHGEGGHILNTASIGGLQVNPQLRNGPYAMTKYAVVAMSETLALDLEGSGIGVSVFCPALVATNLMRSGNRRPERFGGRREPADANQSDLARRGGRACGGGDPQRRILRLHPFRNPRLDRGASSPAAAGLRPGRRLARRPTRRLSRTRTVTREEQSMAITKGVEASVPSSALSLQIRVAVLCGLIQMLDGYDLSAIGLAVPSLIKAWSLPPPAFTQAFALSSVGIMVGALSSGPLADRFGRKPILLVSVA